MAVQVNSVSGVGSQRSLGTILQQVLGPLLQILTFVVGSAVILGTLVIVLALVLQGTREDTDLVRGTLVILPQVIVDALVRGFLYAMIALGYTMVYGVLEFINFAHGEIFMVGAFVAAGFGFFLQTSELLGGFNPLLFVLLAVVMGMTVSGLLAVSIERVAYRPLRNAPRLVPLISAIGMSLLLQDFVRMIATATPLGFNTTVRTPDLGAALCLADIGTERVLDRVTDAPICPLQIPLVDGRSGVIIDSRSLIFIVVSIIMLIGLNYLVNVTRLGKAIRAVAQDRATASLMGINVNTIIAITFLIGGALGGLPGCCLVSGSRPSTPTLALFPA